MAPVDAHNSPIPGAIIIIIVIIIILYYAKWQQITDTTNTNTIKHTTSYKMLHTQLGNELSLNNKRDTIKS